MTYRLPPLEVPADDPFRFDVLGRKPLVEFLCGLIERAGGPFVLALDSPWGSGKTTLISMLRAELARQGYCCIYFNAWEIDYVTDPLVALVSSIDRVELGGSSAGKTFKQHLKKVRKVTSVVARRSVVAAAKAVTIGALDLEEEVEAAAAELAGESAKDIVEVFQKERSLLNIFRSELEAAVAQLGPAGKKPSLIFFVDEMDRCRPTFALELLERIKHLFDVSNIVFVISLDKSQLGTSLSAVYGHGLDAQEYLRRFFDLEYLVPVTSSRRFAESLFARFGFEPIFSKRTHADLRSDKSNLVDFFADLSDAVGLSLRGQERCFTRFRVVMDQTPADHYLHPVLVALLVVLRAKAPELFRGLVEGRLGSPEVMDYLRRCPNGDRLVGERSGAILEAYLIASDGDEKRQSQALLELEHRSQDAGLGEADRKPLTRFSTSRSISGKGSGDPQGFRA